MSQFFVSGGQSIGASSSGSVLPISIQEWFPLWWTGWISLQSKGLSRVFSNTTVQKHQFFGAQPSLWSNSHIHTWLLEKTIALTRWIFVGKVMSLLFNMLSRFFSPRSKHLLIYNLDPHEIWCSLVSAHHECSCQRKSWSAVQGSKKDKERDKARAVDQV